MDQAGPPILLECRRQLRRVTRQDATPAPFARGAVDVAKVIREFRRRID